MDDIPNQDELEWLESNLQDEGEDDDYFYAVADNEESDEPQQQQQQQSKSSPVTSVTLNFTPKSSSRTNPITNKKRPLLETEELVIEKRNRVTTDEDWFRYSPPPPPAPAPVLDVVVELQEKFISRFASEIEGDCVPVTGPCGKRVYAKMSRVEMNDVTKKLDVKGYPHGLISEPINTLMEKMDQNALLKALQDSAESPGDLIHADTPVVSEQLWVEKYAPSSFTELLSDERANREVLLWLKQWDTCVFGSKIRSTEDAVLSALKRHSSLSQQQKSSGKSYINKNRRTSWVNNSFEDSGNLGRDNNNLEDIPELWNKKPITTGPPDQKVLLLCGPPGLGKTTLAHVAAKHCGYRVVEINASDDRSSSAVEAKILDVVQMNSVMADAKPKCLVIDEIDGSLGEGKGAVEAILKMIDSEKKYEAGKRSAMQEEQSGKGSSKKRRKNASLCRPVICICNDLYAPALRPLRQVAKVHVFLQPTVSRVVNRLKYICNKEGFRTKSAGLTALAEYTECDIRSCLNTLQFLNKKKEILNVLEISSQVIGRKDVSRSVFDVWKEVFQKRKVKRERKAIDSRSLMSREFDSLQSLISNCGEYELTMDGIHENVLQLSYHDPMMQKTVECLNIFGVSDYLHKHIMRTQQMSLLAYQPSTAIAIHRLVAQIEKPTIEWPKSFQKYRMTLTEKKDLLKCWQNKISPSVSRHLTTECFVEDAISPLLHILSPPTLRPVALHLQSERENDDLSQLVETMLSYTITYKNSILELPASTLRYEAYADTSTLVFDPPINEFINFKGYNSGLFGLSLAMKQVVLHKVERQKILRESITKPSHSSNGSNMNAHDFSGTERNTTFSAKTATVTAYANNSIQYTKDNSHPGQQKTNTVVEVLALESNKSSTVNGKLKSHDVPKKRSGGSSCFFDRFRKSGETSSQNRENVKKSATLERDSRPLLFKYNEGFTNAVKRPVRIRDLLL